MRTFALVLLAAAGLAVAVPAVAQDVYVGGRGVGVGVDVDSGYRRDREYRSERYRTEGYSRRARFERCSTTIIRRDDGSVRKIRRCRD